MRLERNVAHRICEVLPQRIAFLPIVEIGYCALGRGDAVEAGRELPAHPRMPSLPAPYRDKEFAVGFTEALDGMRIAETQWVAFGAQCGSR